MIRASSQVKLNLPAMGNLKRAQITALEQTAEALHTEIVQAQVVPRDTGNLQNEAFFMDRQNSSRGIVSLVHSTPYARRLYFHPEFHFSKDANPNARGKWFEDWLPGGRAQEFAQNAYKELYRRLTGV